MGNLRMYLLIAAAMCMQDFAGWHVNITLTSSYISIAMYLYLSHAFWQCNQLATCVARLLQKIQ